MDDYIQCYRFGMIKSGSYFLGRSGSYPLNQSQLNNWQILSVHNETAARLLKHFEDFLGK
jgi:hypothetical protein